MCNSILLAPAPEKLGTFKLNRIKLKSIVMKPSVE